jgi:FkbM family methyltransferase
MRIKIIQKLIHFNEKLLFYPKLRSFYLKNLKIKNPVIFDVGTNRGQSIDFFLEIFKDAKIYGFEPNSKLYEELIVKYKNHSNVKIFNLGVSDFNGQLEFKESIMDETSTFEELNQDSEYLKKKLKILGVNSSELFSNAYMVKVVRLDTLLNDLDIKQIDILKIDTEGHEFKCLLGLNENKSFADIKCIQLESHKDDMYEENNTTQIHEFLNQRGYNQLTKINHGFGEIEEHLYLKNAL